MDDYRHLEERWWLAVAHRFGVPVEMDARVKSADKRALNTEKRDLRGGPPKARTPIPYGETIEPWGWEQARDAFLDRARELGVAVEGHEEPRKDPTACPQCGCREEAEVSADGSVWGKCGHRWNIDGLVTGHDRNAAKDTYPAPGVWVNPQRQGGQPCIEGTRIPTMAIAELFASGKRRLDLLADYPSLGDDFDKVDAALRYELRRLLERYEPEGDGDGDEGDEPDRLRGRVAEAEQQIESIDCAIAGAVTKLSGQITKAEEGRHRADRVLDDVLERLDRLSRDVARLQQIECTYTAKPEDGGPSDRSWLIARTSNNESRIDDLERRMSAVDSYGVDALREALRELGFDQRVEQLERDLARVQKVEAGARALGYLDGVQRRGAPRPGSDDDSIPEAAES